MSLKKLVLFLIVAFVACSFAVDVTQETPMDDNLEELDFEFDLERDAPLNEPDVQEETLLDPEELQSAERTDDELVEVQGSEPSPDVEPDQPIGCPLVRRCGLSCCNPGQFCQDNRCVASCPTFRPTCGTRCCRTNQVCRNGVCSSCPPNSQLCSGRCCPVGTICTGGRCLCPQTRRCGNSCCRSGQFCDTRSNVCVNRCPPTLAICAGKCCRNNEQCSNGVCIRCPNNRIACNGTCCRNDQVCRNRRCQCRTIDCGGVCCGENQLCRDSQCIPRQRCHIQQQCGRTCCSSTQNCDRRPSTPLCVISPPTCTFNQYVGFTQAQWGAVCGRFQPAACFLENNFGTCFSGGYMIGCQPNQGNFIRWTNVSSLQQFLPQSGPNTELQASYINPGQFVNNTASRRAAGAFGGNVAALGLTIGFDDCNQVNLSRGCDPVKSLFVCDRGQAYFRNRRCNLYFGLTVNEIFQLATRSLGGCCRSVPQRRCNVNNLNPCLNAINAAFQGEQNLVNRFSNNEFSKVRCPPS